MPRGRQPKQTIDLDYLDATEKSLRKRLAVIKGLQMAMRDAGTDEITVDGTRMLERVPGYLDSFIHSCKRELGEP